MRIAALAILFTWLAGSDGVSEVVLESSDFRRLHDLDPGTARLFIRNHGQIPIALSSVVMDDVPLPVFGVEGPFTPISEEAFAKLDLVEKAVREHSDKRVLWAYAEPNPVPAGGLASVQLKFMDRPQFTRKFKLEFSDNQNLSAEVSPRPAPLRISFVGFDEDYSRVYVYLSNQGHERIDIESVALNGIQVTDSARIWPKALSAYRDRKGLVIAGLAGTVKEGAFIDVRISGAGESAGSTVVAHERVRVFRTFPIGLEWGKGSVKFGFDDHQITWKFPTGESPDPASAQPSWNSFTYLFDCPMHRFAANYRRCAREILSRMQSHSNAELKRMTSVHLCRARLDRALFMFGELGDVTRFNPYFEWAKTYSNRGYEERGVERFCRLASLAVSPRPFHTVVMAAKIDSERWLRPDEGRLAVYQALASGSKGILYRNWQQPGVAGQSEFENTLKDVNAEIQQLRPYLAVADRFPLSVRTSEGDPSQVSARRTTFLAGDKAIIVFVINRDLQVTEKAGGSFETKPAPPHTLEVKLPEWFEAKAVIHPKGEIRQSLVFTASNGVLKFSLPEIPVASAFLVLNGEPETGDRK